MENNSNNNNTNNLDETELKNKLKDNLTQLYSIKKEQLKNHLEEKNIHIDEQKLKQDFETYIDKLNEKKAQAQDKKQEIIDTYHQNKDKIEEKKEQFQDQKQHIIEKGIQAIETVHDKALEKQQQMNWYINIAGIGMYVGISFFMFRFGQKTFRKYSNGKTFKQFLMENHNKKK